MSTSKVRCRKLYIIRCAPDPKPDNRTRRVKMRVNDAGYVAGEARQHTRSEVDQFSHMLKIYSLVVEECLDGADDLETIRRAFGAPTASRSALRAV